MLVACLSFATVLCVLVYFSFNFILCHWRLSSCLLHPFLVLAFRAPSVKLVLACWHGGRCEATPQVCQLASSLGWSSWQRSFCPHSSSFDCQENCMWRRLIRFTTVGVFVDKFSTPHNRWIMQLQHCQRDFSKLLHLARSLLAGMAEPCEKIMMHR